MEDASDIDDVIEVGRNEIERKDTSSNFENEKKNQLALAPDSSASLPLFCSRRKFKRVQREERESLYSDIYVYG